MSKSSCIVRCTLSGVATTDISIKLGRSKNFQRIVKPRQFLYPERGQKQIFLDYLPPHLGHVVIEWPLRVITWNEV